MKHKETIVERSENKEKVSITFFADENQPLQSITLEHVYTNMWNTYIFLQPGKGLLPKIQAKIESYFGDKDSDDDELASDIEGRYSYNDDNEDDIFCRCGILYALGVGIDSQTLLQCFIAGIATLNELRNKASNLDFDKLAFVKKQTHHKARWSKAFDEGVTIIKRLDIPEESESPALEMAEEIDEPTVTDSIIASCEIIPAEAITTKTEVILKDFVRLTKKIHEVRTAYDIERQNKKPLKKNEEEVAERTILGAVLEGIKIELSVIESNLKEVKDKVKRAIHLFDKSGFKKNRYDIEVGLLYTKSKTVNQKFLKVVEATEIGISLLASKIEKDKKALEEAIHFEESVAAALDEISKLDRLCIKSFSWFRPDKNVKAYFIGNVLSIIKEKNLNLSDTAKIYRRCENSKTTNFRRVSLFDSSKTEAYKFFQKQAEANAKKISIFDPKKNKVEASKFFHQQKTKYREADIQALMNIIR